MNRMNKTDVMNEAPFQNNDSTDDDDDDDNDGREEDRGALWADCVRVKRRLKSRRRYRRSTDKWDESNKNKFVQSNAAAVASSRAVASTSSMEPVLVDCHHNYSNIDISPQELLYPSTPTQHIGYTYRPNVNFDETVDVQEVPCIEDLSAQEVYGYWYTPYELKKIQQRKDEMEHYTLAEIWHHEDRDFVLMDIFGVSGNAAEVPSNQANTLADASSFSKLDRQAVVRGCRLAVLCEQDRLRRDRKLLHHETDAPHQLQDRMLPFASPRRFSPKSIMDIAAFDNDDMQALAFCHDEQQATMEEWETLSRMSRALSARSLSEALGRAVWIAEEVQSETQEEALRAKEESTSVRVAQITPHDDKSSEDDGNRKRGLRRVNTAPLQKADVPPPPARRAVSNTAIDLRLSDDEILMIQNATLEERMSSLKMAPAIPSRKS